MKKLLQLLVAACFINITAKAQEVWSADVQIKSAVLSTSPDSYTAKFTIFNYWDDNARNVKASFVIPFGARVLAVSAGCSISPTGHGSNGVVYCNLGEMRVREEKIVEIKINKIFTPGRPEYFFHGLVTNESPDPDPKNNVKLLKIE